jgi:hypothetical protein
MRVLLENMILRNPLGFFVFTPAAQQESNEGAVQEVMLNRVLFERDVWRWRGSGNRIPSCNSVEGGVWRERDDEIWRVALGWAGMAVLVGARYILGKLPVTYVRIRSREKLDVI